MSKKLLSSNSIHENSADLARPPDEVIEQIFCCRCSRPVLAHRVISLPRSDSVPSLGFTGSIFFPRNRQGLAIRYRSILEASPIQ